MKTEMPDKSGNAIIIVPVNQDKDEIYLRLASAEGEKMIGTFEKGFFKKRVKEKHIFKKLNAVGFNYNAVEFLQPKGFKLIIDGLGEYAFSLEQFYRHATEVLHFKQQGFEVQRFMPIEKMRKVK